MNSEQLKTILAEYPPSRRLFVIVDGARVQETTVMDVMVKLIEGPQSASLTFLGRDSCIIRERLDDKWSPIYSGPEFNKWLEIDLR